MSELSSYCVRAQTSRGRRYEEKAHRYRDPFERDRDRVIHSQAFRRLEGKTQVFTPGVNDNYRNRLTHSIEVSQIGRTIAKALKLNESLTEAVCLAHDIGHSPFGHCGEDVLNDLMKDWGGFEHNRQALRIVDILEHPYPDFAGLNLMYETRLALAKHKSPFDRSEAEDFTEKQCSLEGQVADLADRIAYNCHDLEDGLGARLINEQQIKNVAICVDASEKINADSIDDTMIRRIRIAKTIIDTLVSDCIESSTESIEQADVRSAEDVYRQDEPLIRISESAEIQLRELEKFLYDNMYMSPVLLDSNKDVKDWLVRIFEKFCSNPQLLPGYYQRLIDEHGLQRIVCDYIAGMTDRFCLSVLKKI